MKYTSTVSANYYLIYLGFPIYVSWKTVAVKNENKTAKIKELFWKSCFNVHVTTVLAISSEM